MKKPLIIFPLLFLFGCQNNGIETEPAQENIDATRASATSYEVYSERICAGLDFDIYSIASGNNSAKPVMAISGTECNIYASDPEGKEWHYAMSSSYGDRITIRSIATGSGKFSGRWMAAADQAIMYTIYDAENWYRFYRNDDLVFNCVGLNYGRMNRYNTYYFGATGDDGHHLFAYTLWDDGATSWTEFNEVQPGVGSNYNAITGTHEHLAYGVTERGEFLRMGSTEEEHTVYFPWPLNTAQVYWMMEYNEFGSGPVPHVYVAGENGFMAKIRDGEYSWGTNNFNVEVVNTGIRETISCLAVEGSVYDQHETEPIVLAGGPDGLLILSTDGKTFEKLDIGFEGDVRDIAWHEYTGSFFVVGGHGEIHEVKVIRQ